MTTSGHGSGNALTFLADAGEFLVAAHHYLAARPVVSTVVTTIAHRTVSATDQGAGRPFDPWWLVVRDETGSVVGAGMRTASFPPYPPFLLPMPEDSALALAHTLHCRGEQVLAVNGALPAAEIVGHEVARLTGGRVQVAAHTRLFELDTLVRPAAVPGRLVAATENDLDLVTAWFTAFHSAADDQAGRQPASSAHDVPESADLRRRIESGCVWFWVDGTGARVHLTAANPAALGVARLGPVYTPPEQRGRGWASSAVAEVSARLVARGARVCLFTDQANPTSNKIYLALGYRPVADMANFVIAPGLYDAAGGAAGMLSLAAAWHARVLTDDVVSHAFSHGFHPEHTDRLAAYLGEALGGPPAYTATYGDETTVERMHSGNGAHEEMDDRAIACFDAALQDIGLGEDERLRRVLHDYFAWATRGQMARYPGSADDVPDGLHLPRWSWTGPVD